MPFNRLQQPTGMAQIISSPASMVVRPMCSAAGRTRWRIREPVYARSQAIVAYRNAGAPDSAKLVRPEPKHAAHRLRDDATIPTDGPTSTLTCNPTRLPASSPASNGDGYADERNTDGRWQHSYSDGEIGNHADANSARRIALVANGVTCGSDGSAPTPALSTAHFPESTPPVWRKT